MTKTFQNIPDWRQVSKTDYSIHNCLMAGFACMFYQDPSFLQFQERLKDFKNKCNLETQFQVKEIPQETQMKSILDHVPSEKMRPIFKNFFYRIQRSKYLKLFEFMPKFYLISIDGTQYFSSQNIFCTKCLQAKKEDGKVTYSHKVIQAALMHPNQKQVIPLMPEEISNSDGTVKQDCEQNACKRLISKIRKDHPQLGIILVGDGLYSKQSTIETVLKHQMHYVFVAKPKDHKIMMEWIEEQRVLGELQRKEFIDEKGRKLVYEWINKIPLNGRADAIEVNYFKFQIHVKQKDGTYKLTFQNTWITDLKITEENVALFVKGGRCRWKIENECFNTLKNQGYCIKHNYGHGSKNLCFNFYLFTLLAFFSHQIFELTDDLYKYCRQIFGSKKALWEALRQAVRYFVFNTWEEALKVSLGRPIPP